MTGDQLMKSEKPLCAIKGAGDLATGVGICLFEADYPLIMTASVISVLPILIVFLIFQRQIIESVALTGSKI